MNSKLGSLGMGLDNTGNIERNIASCEPRRGESRRSFLVAGNWNNFVIILKQLEEKKVKRPNKKRKSRKLQPDGSEKKRSPK